MTGGRRYVPAREVEIRDECVTALRLAIEHSQLGKPISLRAHLRQSSLLVRELDELHALALGIVVREIA